MKELVEVIAKALVDDPESVTVNERTEKKTTILEVRVADSDMGKVIGKQGRIAKAIRSVVKAAAAKEDKKVIVDIQDGYRDRPGFTRPVSLYEERNVSVRTVKVLRTLPDIDIYELIRKKRRNVWNSYCR